MKTLFSRINARHLLHVLFGYVLLQFSWWAYLIYSTQKKLYPDKNALYMVLGEGMVFLLLLIIGVYFIHRYLKKQEQEKKLQADLLLSVTHELKTPLTAVNLSLQSIKKTATNQKMITSGLRQSKKMGYLIDNLINASSLESTKYAIHFEAVDASELLKKTIIELLEFYPSLKEKIEVKVTSDIILKTDRYALFFIFKNIIENALKYAKEHTQIHITFQSENNQGVLKVKNTIDPQTTIQLNSNKNDMYQKFLRFNSHKTGMGLGLYLVKEFSKLINTNVSHSISDDKITFILILPL